MAWSPSVRGRGSKRQLGGPGRRKSAASPSVRGRGSKRASCLPAVNEYCAHVALRAGAWIETSEANPRLPLSVCPVALRAGAWIETGPTDTRHDRAAASASPSVRGRGSKPLRWCYRVRYSCPRRPPCGGVDRNWSALSLTRPKVRPWSPSVRGRGSKPAGPAQQPSRARPRTSPSVRGRGSKQLYHRRSIKGPMAARSPSVRGRGSKPLSLLPIKLPRLSPSVRGRGSKRHPHGAVRRRADVALRAGAWIETAQSSLSAAASPPAVALRAGAWIETCRLRHAGVAIAALVALRAGAWIETPWSYGGEGRRPRPASPSVRGRGSKPSCPKMMLPSSWGDVALRAGAWIETSCTASTSAGQATVALRAGAWIETCSICRRSANRPGEVALRAGAWIETPTICWAMQRRRPVGVALRAGAWIETPRRTAALYQAGPARSPSVRGRGSKQL